MRSSSVGLSPEALHPSLWRASQLAKSHTKCIDSGHPSLSRQLPGGGWPTGALTELMQQQPGIGELRMLSPALSKVASRRIIMLEPPQMPQALGMPALGIRPEHLIWIRSTRTADTLWAAEQVLRSGSCGALLMWQNQVRAETLRRLNLAAQYGETLCFIFRPLAAAQDPSAAPLRLSLRPAEGGINIEFIKRRGPSTDQALFLPLPLNVVLRPATHDRAYVGRPARTAVFDQHRSSEFLQ
jgi:protein ImuA